MFYCCVENCNNSNKLVKMFRFPYSNKKVFSVWISRIDNMKLQNMDPRCVYNNFRICEKHFAPFCLNKFISRKPLKPGSLPSIGLPGFHEESTLENTFYWKTKTVSENVGSVDESIVSPSKSEALVQSPVPGCSYWIDDPSKTQAVISSQEFLNCESRVVQSTKEISEKLLDAFESTIVLDQDVESEHVEIVSEKQPDAFDVQTEQRQPVKSKDTPNKLGTEFGDELKCRTCMQITYDGLSLDAPCFTTRSIKDIIIQLLPELVPSLEQKDVICPNCVNKFNTILEFLENCLRVNKSLACLADKKDLDSLGEQNNEKPLVLEEDDSLDDMIEGGGKSMDIEKQNEVVAKEGIKPGPKRCFIYSTFLTIPNNDNVVSFKGIESNKSLELARTFTDLGIRVADESKGNGKKRIVLIGNKNIWMCPICRMAFRLESELHRHAVEVHNLLKAHLLTPKTYFNKNTDNSEKCKVFNCPYCNESLPMNSLVTHTLEKHGDPKPFKCFNCRQVFGSYKLYKRHSNVFYRHRFYTTVCKICDKRIKWESYKEHFDSHKTFQCEFCDKCFTNITSLRTHEATHKAIPKGESTLCPFCGKTFSIQGLNIHVKRVHEEQTKGDVLCHICSKTLCTKRALVRHIDSVHNAKLVDCKLCGKIFRSNISLQYHLRCNVCSVKFGCPFCKREFIRKNRLKMHMIKNHNSSIISESKIIRRRIRSDDVGEVENTENQPNIINDLDANVGMNMEIES